LTDTSPVQTIRALTNDELTCVSGGAVNVVNFGGGVSWAVQPNGVTYLCDSDKCVAHPVGSYSK
jgi:hypothetical protein